MATTLAMVFKLAERDQHKWQMLNSHQLIENVFGGVTVINGG